jgi:hypothetical protein
LISGRDHAGTTTQELDLAEARPAGDLPPMTPETARRLAAVLAPHLVAMRAVTAGTRYEGSGEGQAGDDGLRATGASGASPGPAAPISPATKIFIAGMLERISA